nr:MAG TPA: hypothetical protein [Caudoviricetes sp.]
MKVTPTVTPTVTPNNILHTKCTELPPILPDHFSPQSCHFRKSV